MRWLVALMVMVVGGVSAWDKGAPVLHLEGWTFEMGEQIENTDTLDEGCWSYRLLHVTNPTNESRDVKFCGAVLEIK